MLPVTDPSDPLHITDKKRLFELLAQRRKGQARIIDEQEMRAALKRRVRGQDHIIDHLSSYIRLQWGKQRRDTPIANLLFVGPPATGKTELAKALAEFLFGDEKNILPFDCGELSAPEGKTRLIGSPTGYVGAAEGGHLTRPMLTNPKRLVLFDEIEKAHSSIFDLFLSMMGEGRLTEQGSGRVVDFTQSIIVLTSNKQHDAIASVTRQLSDPAEQGRAVRSVLRESQAFRPEIISRFDQVYVFGPLNDDVNAEIAGLKIAKAGADYGVTIEFIDPEIVLRIMEQAAAAGDAREVRRMVDATLGELLMQARDAGSKKVRVLMDEQGKPTVAEAT